MKCFTGQLKNFPHPRSVEAIEALAKLRASTVGVAYAEAFSLLQTVRGNCEVQTTLGLMHMKGLGCPRKVDVGIALLEQASMAGSSRADFNLYYHFNDIGQHAKALSYLVKAADRDDTDALFLLADEYSRSGNAAKMEHCLVRGARLGDGRAVRLLKNQKERMCI